MALNHPPFVVQLRPLDERTAQLLDGRERADPQQLLLERADGPLRAAVPFRRTDERRARADAEEGDLLLKGIAHVLAPVVVPQLKPESDVATDRAKVLAHTLTDWLERFPAGRALGRMDTDDLRGVVVDSKQHRRLAFLERHR